MLRPQEFTYIQVVNSTLETGEIITLIGATNSQEKTHGIDELLLRHYRQLYTKYNEIQVELTWLVFMSSDGEMSSQLLIDKLIDNTNKK